MMPVSGTDRALGADTSGPAHGSPSEQASILALSAGSLLPGIGGKKVGSGSRDSAGGWASGLNLMGRDGDRKAALAAVAGVAAVGLCFAFVYCHPKGKSW